MNAYFKLYLFVFFGGVCAETRLLTHQDSSAKIANELQVIILLEEEFMISHFFSLWGGQYLKN